MLLAPRMNPYKQIEDLEKSHLSIKGEDTINDFFTLCQITDKDIESLTKIDDIVEEHAEYIADRHYEMIMMIPQISSIFNANTTYEKYTRLIAAYYKQLTKPTLDEDYIKYREKVGQIHSRIRLTDEWVIGSFTRVYEYLFPIIIQRFHSKPRLLSDVLTALNKIITFDSLIILGAYQEANDYYLVESVSDVMDSVMKTDKVKGLIEDVNHTREETSSVSSAAVELSASVGEVAQHATDVSGQTSQMIIDTRKGQEVIKNSLNGFMNMGDDFRTMEDRIEHLVKDVQEITQVVELIQNIAEETNLLALNASIEAARAGESGSGFSVVASEVRKLAEQTKDSVQQISGTITEIQYDSQEVGSIVGKMSSVLSERMKQANDAIDKMTDIVEGIQTVGESTENIAAIAEEQSAATDDITDRIVVAHDYTEKIKESTNITGESIYDASVEINHMRLEAISVIPDISINQLIRVTETEHRLWRWWLYNNELGFHSLSNTKKDVGECRLGMWINQMKNDTGINHIKEFKELEHIHQRFHHIMDEIYVLKEASEERKDKLAEVEKVSEQIFDTLRRLKTSI